MVRAAPSWGAEVVPCLRAPRRQRCVRAPRECARLWAVLGAQPVAIPRVRRPRRASGRPRLAARLTALHRDVRLVYGRRNDVARGCRVLLVFRGGGFALLGVRARIGADSAPGPHDLLFRRTMKERGGRGDGSRAEPRRVRRMRLTWHTHGFVECPLLQFRSPRR